MRVPFVWTLVTCLSILPTAIQATESSATSSEPLMLQNVELDRNGDVQGQFLNEAGQPLAGEIIEVRSKDNIQKLRTDAQGRFSVSKLQGACAIIAKNQNYACRLWKHGMAPPKSLTSFTIVDTNGVIVRAQSCGEGCDDGYGGRSGRLGGVSGGQLLGLALLAGAVVAIVIAVENDNGS